MNLSNAVYHCDQFFIYPNSTNQIGSDPAEPSYVMTLTDRYLYVHDHSDSNPSQSGASPIEWKYRIIVRDQTLIQHFKSITGENNLPPTEFAYLIASDLIFFIDQLLTLARSSSVFRNKLMDSHEKIIVYKLLRTLKNDKIVYYRSHVHPQVDQVIEFMHHRLHKDISLDELAADINVSVSSLTRLFKTELFKTPIAVLLELRLQRAAKRLCVTDESVLDVSIACGFNTLSYFSKVFKDYYGMTPQGYRQQNKEPNHENQVLDFSKVQALAGNLRPEDLTFVDYRIGDKMGIFVPNGDVFEYATDLHHLPSYLFCILSHNRNFIRIDDKLIPMQPGKLMTVSPFVEHTEVPLDLQSRYWAICVERAYFHSELKKHISDIPNYRAHFSRQPEGLMTYMRAFMEEIQRDILYSKEIVQCLETTIIDGLLESLIEDHNDLPAEALNKNLESVLAFIYSNTHRTIKVQELSDILGLSITQTTKVFKKKLGYTPKAYMDQIRLDRARTLLATTANSVKEIANACGYSSSRHMHYAFKRNHLDTPKAYCQSTRNSAIRIQN